MAKESIVFIGPMGVGKTTAAKMVAERLGLEYVDVDELRWDYFLKQPDYDNKLVKELFDNAKASEAFDYMKPFEARFVADIVKRYSSAVFDFGAGYTVYEDEALFDSVQRSLSSFRHVVFLRYSQDGKESLEALRNRHEGIPDELYFYLNKQFVESPCNSILATHIVDTKGKTADMVAEEIVAKLQI